MGYSYGHMSEADGMIGLFMLLLVVWLVGMIFAIVCYVFQALGLYTIAKRRTIRHPWLSWIPVASLWVLGCVSDQYRYVVRGRTTNRRKILLGLTIVTTILSGILSGGYINILGRLFTYAGSLDYMTEDQVLRLFLSPMLRAAGTGMVVSVLGIVKAVFTFIALYDLYTSCDPRNNVLFLVLSILFSVTQPFFVFACRNKDFGMPPRKQAIPEQQPTWQPVQNGEYKEPWEQNQS